MYSVSREMPLQSFQIVSPCDNQSDFKSGQIIRFNIPRQVEYFDAHLSKVQFNCRTSGANHKMAFSSDKAGVASMIDMIRISQNGRVISEVQEYATLQHFVKSYENTLSTAQVDALSKGCVDVGLTTATQEFASSNSVLAGQGLNRSGDVSMTEAEQDVKFQLTLDFISLFEELHVVPMLLMGDVLVEMRLVQEDSHIMKVLPSTGLTHSCTAVATGDTSLTLSPPFAGFTNLADSPFVVGMSVQTTTGTAEYAITTLTQAQSTGVITIGLGTAIDAGDDTNATFTISKGSDGVAGVASPEFIVSKAEMLLQVVKPPESYVQSMISQAESEGIVVDLDTFTTYRNTIQANIKSQTITIPTTQSRAKAVVSIPRAGNQVVAYTKDNSTDYRHEGIYDSLKSYRSQYNGNYYPNAPITLDQFLGAWHFPQEHVREVEKTFASMGIAFRSLECLKQNFALCRGLSQFGSSTDLTGTPINVYVDYNTNTNTVKDVISYVAHKTRLMITPMGVEIMT